MGWPTKGSGKSYNSNTGFANFLGVYTKGVLSSQIYCRRCRVCENAKKKHTPPNKHDCVQNWATDLSSKSMEPAAILKIVTEAPSRGYIVHWIVSDDDSVMRAHLKHKTSTSKTDKGKLPIWIMQPHFMADPGHRNKSVASKFYKLSSAPVSVSRVSPAMAKRLKKNWGYMLRQGRNCTNISEFMLKAKAVLEHMFDNHLYCSSTWCLALRAKEDGKSYNHPSGWLSCKNERDQKIYQQLNAIVSLYGNEFYLNQSMHPFDTQTNEAMMQAQAMLTPKAKVFHESRSFHYRHAIVVGTHNWGARKFWTNVFRELGIHCSSFFLSHLDQVDRKKRIQKVYHKSIDTKRSRAHKQDACEKKLLYENRTAEYASGIGLDIGKEKIKKVKKVQKKQTTKRTACRCGSTTHLTSNHHSCKFNKKNLASIEEKTI